MRTRTEVALGFSILAGLGIVAVAAGRANRVVIAEDIRPSVFNTGPAGWHATAIVLERAGVRVTRWRQRLQSLGDRLTGATVVVVQPGRPVTPGDVRTLFTAVTEHGTHVVTTGGTPLARCAGYAVDYTWSDSVRGAQSWITSGRPHIVTAPESTRTLPGDMGSRNPCPRLAVAVTEILYRTPDDSIGGVRLRTAEQGTVTILAEPSPLSNKGLRTTGRPEQLLAPLMAPGAHVIFSEFHQGASEGGSLGSDALRWSLGSPFGWTAWHLIVVAILGWLLGALRFGPITRQVIRERRSALEHVRALATALAAARGHGVAIGALVRGLQRRLVAAGHDGRAQGRGQAWLMPWRPWLAALPARLPDRQARAAAEQLIALADQGQSDAAVRAAAHSVEDVWEALHR